MTKLFQIAAIWEPTADQAKSGGKAKLIVHIQAVLCTDDKAANVIAARAIPEGYINQLEQINIVVRPF